eukprot:CAMPEP_0170527068 /NCGR_PEP_ID=MMETSP0209-20121228/12495_1 /TAXON_ID=665100 ORGANISM="Litonotus pictus, Strain P1" /NCGR_SAMPLE_ID=MMETSP0209 /ASSEMBLY_ACC=CAM_ASM_000301 /LENGTH=642 /DNA_ID=CAMNT_0010817315 /DNA_START=169 /DNA_END=2095 /DNA_ORIENTATION=-
MIKYKGKGLLYNQLLSLEKDIYSKYNRQLNYGDISKNNTQNHTPRNNQSMSLLNENQFTFRKNKDNREEQLKVVEEESDSLSIKINSKLNKEKRKKNAKGSEKSLYSVQYPNSTTNREHHLTSKSLHLSNNTNQYTLTLPTQVQTDQTHKTQSGYKTEVSTPNSTPYSNIEKTEEKNVMIKFLNYLNKKSSTQKGEEGPLNIKVKKFLDEISEYIVTNYEKIVMLKERMDEFKINEYTHLLEESIHILMGRNIRREKLELTSKLSVFMKRIKIEDGNYDFNFYYSSISNENKESNAGDRHSIEARNSNNNRSTGFNSELPSRVRAMSTLSNERGSETPNLRDGVIEEKKKQALIMESERSDKLGVEPPSNNSLFPSSKEKVINMKLSSQRSNNTNSNTRQRKASPSPSDNNLQVKIKTQRCNKSQIIVLNGQITENLDQQYSAELYMDSDVSDINNSTILNIQNLAAISNEIHFNCYTMSDSNIQKFLNMNNEFSGTNICDFRFEIENEDLVLCYQSDVIYFSELLMQVIDELVDLNKSFFTVPRRVPMKTQHYSSFREEITATLVFCLELDDVTRMEIISRILKIFNANKKLHYHYSFEFSEIVDKYFSEVSRNILQVLEGRDIEKNPKTVIALNALYFSL